MLSFNLYLEFKASKSLSAGSSHSTDTWTILADRATTTSGYCDISGNRCLMKLWRPSLAVWLVPASITPLWNFQIEFHQSATSTEYVARVVLRRRKFENITPSLKELHWLPVQYRVTLKTVVLVHSIKKYRSTNLPSSTHTGLRTYSLSSIVYKKTWFVKVLLELYWHLVVQLLVVLCRRAGLGLQCRQASLSCASSFAFWYTTYLIIFVKIKLVTFITVD